jgi:hypothetical protein
VKRVARTGVLGASLAALVFGGQLAAGGALADQVTQGGLHNVTYRARVDGVSRGTLISYRVKDSALETANPTMLPGRTFEANTVLADPKNAGMEVSVRWPYSANLHCEILVDDTITAQADDFVAPRLLPANDDPGYGKLVCGSDLGTGSGNVVNDQPVSAPPGGAPAPAAPPAQGPPT